MDVSDASIGSAAAAAGYDVATGAEDANLLHRLVNKVLDYLTVVYTELRPVTRGGTGASSAESARSNLGINLSTADSAQANKIPVYNGTAQLTTADPTLGGHAASKKYVDSVASAEGKVSKSGDTMTGQLYLPNSFAASSGYTVAYINTDGRVSRGASSERYKKFIHDAPDLGNLFDAPLREFQMRSDGIVPSDPKWIIGYIAEELVGTDMERFVVYLDGQVESIDFISLLLAQVSDLNARLEALEA